MSVSLVISVYNDVRSLAAVLRSVKVQSFKKFEVIVAQDGDDSCFDELITEYQSFFPIQHLQQADEGFLKNRILNEAIRRANYDKLVFIDGDCFLHPHFLKAYNQSIQKGKICMGRRIDLDPKTTALVKEGTVTRPPFTTMIKNGTTRVEEVFYLPWLSQRFHSRPKLIGCNMGWHKEDLLSLNGFDEDYTNPGYGEDSDIEWRAKKAGIEAYSVRYKAIQFHLDHTRPNREEKVSNSRALFEQKKAAGLSFCERGVVRQDNVSFLLCQRSFIVNWSK